MGFQTLDSETLRTRLAQHIRPTANLIETDGNAAAFISEWLMPLFQEGFPFHSIIEVMREIGKQEDLSVATQSSLMQMAVEIKVLWQLSASGREYQAKAIGEVLAEKMVQFVSAEEPIDNFEQALTEDIAKLYRLGKSYNDVSDLLDKRMLQESDPEIEPDSTMEARYLRLLDKMLEQWQLFIEARQDDVVEDTAAKMVAFLHILYGELGQKAGITPDDIPDIIQKALDLALKQLPQVSQSE